MDTLLDPDSGLIIWTIASFLILVFLLKSVAWKPLLAAVEAREKRLRDEREAAEKARTEAEKIQKELETRMNEAQAEAKKLISKAGADGEALRARLKKEAQDDAKNIIEKTRTQLGEEKRRLIGELRSEVATLSVKAAEKLMGKSVDAGVQKNVLNQFFDDLKVGGKN